MASDQGVNAKDNTIGNDFNDVWSKCVAQDIAQCLAFVMRENESSWSVKSRRLS
jgi:hypothetical protein